MDRYWLLTWTTYGTWLPGDERGFVSQVNDGCGKKTTHNIPGTPYDKDWSRLRTKMAQSLKCPPIYLVKAQAKAIFAQFQETCTVRGWQLIATAIMANHCHVVLGVPGDPEPEKLLGDLKSYASRTLNRKWQKPASGTWWTESGSKRKLKDDEAVLSAVAYVRDQEYPFVVEIDSMFAAELGSGIAPGKIRSAR